MRWMLLLAVGMITACSSNPGPEIIAATPAYVHVVTDGSEAGRVALAEEHCQKHGRHAQLVSGSSPGRFACVP